MASTPKVSDGTLWADLLTSAKNGKLELEPGTAEQCARHVESMLEVVVGVQNWISQNTMVASPVIAESVSGRLLWTVFSQKFGTELRQRVDRHREILVDMGNTFVTAGKRYARTEDESAASFEDISFTPSGTPPSGAPPKGVIPDHPGRLKPTTKYDAYGFGPEMGAQLGWETLYIVCNSMDPQAVANAAGVWKWLSTTLDTGFTTLRTSIASTSDRWEGVGSQNAIGATNAYVEASKQLTGDMNLLGETLTYTSGWLQQTKQNAMPPTPSPPPADSISQNMANELNLIRYQENFQLYYSDNYTHTTTRIVTLPTPDPVTVPAVDIGGETTRKPAGEPLPVNDEETKPGGGDSGSETPTEGGEGGGGEGGGGEGDGGEGGGEHGGGDGSGGSKPPPVVGNPDPVTKPPGDPTKPPTSTKGLNEGLLSSLNKPPGQLSTDPSRKPGILAATVPPSGTQTGAPIVKGGGGVGGKGVIGRAPLALGTSANPLFPRAVAPVESRVIGRAGPASGYQPGMPHGGVPGRSTSDEEREKRRKEYLNSTEHLEEALGEPGRGIRPVLDR
ncbi:hypothetical protein DFR70_108257 [Nocardia tenerifensis]|uniref:PPE family protein n=1 Tax=Nocardia tenerifensis TaxID=228006 RepID=A0A318JY57_9NOCA|nr:hypothetical protein [Nocardia tenerifensis]PXX61699.1 hypothetical protein DFR70_108257 [Nocardia tenerifensis]